MAAHRYPANKLKKDLLSEVLDFGYETPQAAEEFSERIQKVKEKIQEINERISRLTSRTS